MCMSGCKCKEPCKTCSCSKQGSKSKSVGLSDLQDYFKEHREVPLDVYYLKGMHYLAEA